MKLRCLVRLDNYKCLQDHTCQTVFDFGCHFRYQDRILAHVNGLTKRVHFGHHQHQAMAYIGLISLDHYQIRLNCHSTL